jgi:hypothetical protein
MSHPEGRNARETRPLIQLVGLLLILTSLVVTAWWIGSGRVRTGSAVALCALGIVAVCAGMFVMLQERLVAVTVQHVGTLNAAGQQVTRTAQEVASLKDRIDAQSATVTRVTSEVTRQHEEATATLAALDQALQQGQQAVAELQASTRFNAQVLAAQHDDRHAYDQLWQWSEDERYPFRQAAVHTVQTIMDQHNPMLLPTGFPVPWKADVDPHRLSVDQLQAYMAQASRAFRIGVLEFVWDQRTDLSTKARLQFLADVLRHDQSLEVVEYAGRYFAQGTGDKFKPLAIPQHLQWWQEHQGSIE